MKKILLLIAVVVACISFTSCQDDVTKPYNYYIGATDKQKMPDGNMMYVAVKMAGCGAVFEKKLDPIVGHGLGESAAQDAADAEAFAIFDQNVTKIGSTDFFTSLGVEGQKFDYALFRVEYPSTPEGKAVYTKIRFKTYSFTKQ